MGDSREVFQLRKERRLDEALTKARAGFQDAPQDIWMQRAYGWVLYDLLKREIDAFENQTVSAAHLVDRLDTFLREYRRFGENIGPDLLHSQMLNLALKGSRSWPRFLDFARWWGAKWGANSFRDEDHQPYQHPEGREMPSLALRYIYAVGREAMRQASSADPGLIQWAENQVDTALEHAPNDQWLHYYKSQLLLHGGRADQALEHLFPVLRRQPRAAWAWSLLGHIEEPRDPGNAIICYQHAAQLAHQPQEVANTRISLAKLLRARGESEQAAVQVRKSLEYRVNNNFKVPADLAELANSHWYRDLAQRTDLPPEPDVASQAREILAAGQRAALQYRCGIVDHQNLDKEVAHVAFGLDDGVVLPYRRFPGIQDRLVGDLIEVGFIPSEHRAADWRSSRAAIIPGFVDHISGRVERCDGRDFGFLSASQHSERVFVPPDLMAALKPEQPGDVTCIAVMSKDKKGKRGWKVLRWIDA
jgi:hypothetical protein